MRGFISMLLGTWSVKIENTKEQEYFNLALSKERRDAILQRTLPPRYGSISQFPGI